MKADWVLLKVDALDEILWRRINRPHPSLEHQAILDGMSVFADDFRGTLVTESMILNKATLNRVYQIISWKVKNLELLTGYEGNAFASTGDGAKDLLSITSVHPMREEAVRKLLDKAGTHWHVVEQFIADKQLKVTEYEGVKFYVRRVSDECE